MRRVVGVCHVQDAQTHDACGYSAAGSRASTHSKNEGLPHIVRLVPHPWRRGWIVGNALEDLSGDGNSPTALASNLLSCPSVLH